MNLDEAAKVPDPEIQDGDGVLRRIPDAGRNMLAEDVMTGERRPSSGAFKPDKDGLSVYLESTLSANALGPADLVMKTGNLVVRIPVGDVRSVDLDVVADPWPKDVPEADHPRNAAHALITGWEGMSKNERRRRQRELSLLPSLRFVYPMP